MRITKKKITGVVAGAAVVALGAGAAFAFWTGTGSGTGTATAAQMFPVSATFTFENGLYPGPAGAVDLVSATTDNTNAFPVSVVNIGTPTFTTSGGACNTANLTENWFSLAGLPGGPFPPGAIVVAPGTGVAWAPLPPLTLTMENDPIVNQNVCQGVTVTVTVPLFTQL